MPLGDILSSTLETSFRFAWKHNLVIRTGRSCGMAAMAAASVATTATHVCQGVALSSSQQEQQQSSRVSLGATKALQGVALHSHRGVSVGRSRRRSAVSVVQAIATADSAVDAATDSSSSSSQKISYHFLIANAKFMLDDEEHFQELLKERLRKFKEDGRKQDFWLVIEPQFLSEFPDYKQRLSRPAVALVSTDSVWITFMKLRLDRVLKGSFESESIEDALTGSPVELKFDRPQKWTAPYPKYESNWWTPLLYKPDA